MSSNEKRMPTHRLKFRNKEKQTYDVGTCWEGRFPDSFDIKPEIRRMDGKYPSMPLSEAIRLVEQREGWLSLVAVKSKSDKPQQQRRDEPPDDFGGGDSFGDDEIPF